MADKVSITICGDGGCGKSSITLRLVRSQWTSDYDPTIEDSYSVTRSIDGLSYHLSLTDTAGQEEYRSLWAASNLQSDAFLLVYDITNSHSLEGLTWFLEMIDIESDNRMEENARLLREKGSKVRGNRGAGWRIPPIKIIAGNKCDLKEARIVSSKMGLDWAKRKDCGFMETSARDMVNIEETFAWMVRRVVEARRQSTGITTTTYNHQQTPSGGVGYSQQYPMSPGQQTSSIPWGGNEKSSFGKATKPWWKRMMTCSCFR